MLPAPCYIFSDAHLGFASDAVEHAVLRFLRHLEHSAASVVVNGDLFEFWFEWRTAVPRRGFRTAAALGELADRVPVLMIAGNHDCWGGEVLTQDLHIDYRVGPWEGDLAGWRTRIEHGDGLRPREDRRYRALRRVLRNRFAISAFRWIHPDIASPLASHSSHASRTYGARDGGRGLREAAHRAATRDPHLDLIVFGHSHVPALDHVGADGRTVYANAGSWLDAPTFVRVTPERVALRQWNGSAESADLHAFDRVAEKTLPELKEL